MDDLISRQAAIDLIEHDKIGSGSPFISLPRAQVVNRTCDRHVEGIMNLPSAQKTGTWIDRQEGKWIYAKCNKCGTTWDAKSNYCPNCGAKMESD